MAFRHSIATVGIVLTALVSTVPPATATGSQDATIAVVAVVYAPGQTLGPYQTTIGQLESDGCPTTNADPAIQGPGGALEGATGPTGGSTEWSVGTVLSNPTCLPGTTIELSDVQAVTVVADSYPDLSASAQLTGADLAPLGNPDAGPVFWDSGSAVSYLRPPRSATDDNATDMLTVGQSLQFDVYENQSPATVDVTASATSVAPGSSVTFTASVPGGASGESYQWSFDGAAPAANGASATATFATAGTYQVTVQATGQSNGFGQIMVYVGTPPAGTGTTTTPTGPAVSSGSTPGAPVTKPRHKRRPTAKPRPTAVTQTTKASSAAPASPTPAAGASSTPATSGSAAASGQSGGSVTGRTVTRARKRHRVSEPPASGPAATAPQPGMVVVQGRLLGPVEAVTVGSAGGAGSSADGAPRVDRPVGPWPWAAVVGGLVVVGLLGLGAGRELRSIRFAP